jgi:serine/alanine racemase
MQVKNKMSIDKFRLIAAILIIAIHIYPLASINETLDFIFTHVICRIGVPIFLMITGFFVLPGAIQDRKKLITYTKKIIRVYIISMIIYFPVNIYAGKLKGIGFIGILKEIFINGTFYHLWYFPALILGIWITYYLIKNIKEKKVRIIVIILYIIGLFGDSYYGLTEKLAITKNIYNVIFNIFEYTRNGLFYVPVFIYLGYMIKCGNLKINRKQNIIYIIIAMILMIIEGLILHHFKLQKHDSMYIMLIPLMILLFNLIIKNKGENNKKIRNISTTIYIMHPIFIILIRGVARVIHLQNIMIENSLINYILVVIATIIFSICFEKVKEKVSEKYGRRH